MSQRCAKGPKRRAEYGLHPRAFRPGRRASVDNVDPAFVQTLSESERAWLERFNREYYGADSNSLNSPEALHNTSELRRSVFNAQNAANRCVYSRAAAFEGRLEEMPDDGTVRDDRRQYRTQRVLLATVLLQQAARGSDGEG